MAGESFSIDSDELSAWLIAHLDDVILGRGTLSDSAGVPE
jgi:hypothetical protein